MDLFKEKLDILFTLKTQQAAKTEEENGGGDSGTKRDILPFEVNKVIQSINEETERRKKILKRKDP